MNRFFVSLALITFISCKSSNKMAVQTPAAEDGFINLFDGKTTTGWHTFGKTAVGKAWKVEDGAIHLDAVSKKGYQTSEGGDLVTNEEYDNFHLKLDWRLSPKGNSGV